MQKTCPITGKKFTVTEREMALRKKLGIDGEPEFHPVYRWQVLGAFWPHWALHKRPCDKTGKSIIDREEIPEETEARFRSGVLSRRVQSS